MDGNYYKVGKTNVSVTSIDDVVVKVSKCINKKKSEYICIGNTRTVVYAYKNEFYRNIVNQSFLNTPDGMPLVWAGRLWGIPEASRACGPDIFNAILKQKKRYKHFLLGDTKEVLNKLTMKCKEEYEVDIVGTYSPPFLNYEDFDYKKIAKLINDTNADIVWVALGAPKQDYFNYHLVKHVKGKVLIGVGAVFRYALGEYKEPPTFFKRIALTGLFWKVKYHPFQSLLWYIKNSLALTYFYSIILLHRFFKKNAAGKHEVFNVKIHSENYISTK